MLHIFSANAMRGIKFRTRHMVYKLAYNQITDNRDPKQMITKLVTGKLMPCLPVDSANSFVLPYEL